MSGIKKVDNTTYSNFRELIYALRDANLVDGDDQIAAVLSVLHAVKLPESAESSGGYKSHIRCSYREIAGDVLLEINLSRTENSAINKSLLFRETNNGLEIVQDVLSGSFEEIRGIGSTEGATLQWTKIILEKRIIPANPAIYDQVALGILVGKINQYIATVDHYRYSVDIVETANGATLTIKNGGVVVDSIKIPRIAEVEKK